jgi:hypothetical protein
MCDLDGKLLQLKGESFSRVVRLLGLMRRGVRIEAGSVT